MTRPLIGTVDRKAHFGTVLRDRHQPRRGLAQAPARWLTETQNGFLDFGAPRVGV